MIWNIAYDLRIYSLWSDGIFHDLRTYYLWSEEILLMIWGYIAYDLRVYCLWSKDILPMMQRYITYDLRTYCLWCIWSVEEDGWITISWWATSPLVKRWGCKIMTVMFAHSVADILPFLSFPFVYRIIQDIKQIPANLPRQKQRLCIMTKTCVFVVGGEACWA